MKFNNHYIVSNSIILGSCILYSTYLFGRSIKKFNLSLNEESKEESKEESNEESKEESNEESKEESNEESKEESKEESNEKSSIKNRQIITNGLEVIFTGFVFMYSSIESIKFVNQLKYSE